ncbi:hypothetical protein FHU33_3557 [Blastococcus colisei]|uniref:Uncharacterized protein n=1 Tax=Blastococcus colisei TaxID=1564162 RepID=A0A543PJ16_9ACTN|nr:hypothetical protein [Blastococcus colisei]TQN44075.1 hypothetical protein FHU33_3557 [Blastococcus colisei]
MNEGSSVLAVVDAMDGVPVVWWVDLGPRIAGISRLCGAWVVDGAERAETLQALTATRVTLSTVGGEQALREHERATERVLDLEATVTSVVAVRNELQTAYEEAATSKKNLTPPRWPTLPEPLDIEAAEATAGDPRTARVLGIARWLNDLCLAWDAVEDERLKRSYMRPLGGPAERALPAVIRDAQPGVAA